MQVTSISASEYRNLCTQYIKEALERPSMYYRSLVEFEASLRGHFRAFEQLGLATRDQAFHRAFVRWLEQTRKASYSAGWAIAIENLASDQGYEDPQPIFIELVNEFLANWETCNIESPADSGSP